MDKKEMEEYKRKAEEFTKEYRRLKNKNTGMRQNLTGAKRQRLAENYFYSRPLEERRLLEKEIEALRGMKSESRSRTKVLQLLAQAFISGAGVKVD